MAQRLSNEIIAQVLTDVVTKLDKSINNFRGEMSEIKQDLTAHREATQKVLSRAISVDVKPIEEERSKLLQEVQKEKEAIKNTFKHIFRKVRGIYSYWYNSGQCFYSLLLYFFCNQSRYGQAGEATE